MGTQAVRLVGGPARRYIWSKCTGVSSLSGTKARSMVRCSISGSTASASASSPFSSPSSSCDNPMNRPTNSRSSRSSRMRQNSSA